jgi:hypothetical protein
VRVRWRRVKSRRALKLGFARLAEAAGGHRGPRGTPKQHREPLLGLYQRPTRGGGWGSPFVARAGYFVAPSAGPPLARLRPSGPTLSAWLGALGAISESPD